MYLSTSGTCSFLAMMLSIMPLCLRLFLRHSNCRWWVYVWLWILLNCEMSIICLSDVIMVDFSFFIISAVPNCIIHDIVVINSIILLTYMKSIASVTFLNHSSSALGRSYVAFISIFKSVSLLFFLLMIPSLVQVFLLLAVCLLCWWGSWEAYCLLHIKYNL